MPNAVAMSASIVNCSAAMRFAHSHGQVGLGYELDWRRVHELMKAAALATANVRQAPAPFVLQERLDDYAVEYELNACTSNARAMAATVSELRTRLLDAFHSEGIEIMTPAVTAIRDGGRSAVPEAPADSAAQPSAEPAAES